MYQSIVLDTNNPRKCLLTGSNFKNPIDVNLLDSDGLNLYEETYKNALVMINPIENVELSSKNLTSLILLPNAGRYGFIWDDSSGNVIAKLQ